MIKMSANHAKAKFGQLLDHARRAPVTIEKHGRPVAVVLSTEDYEALNAAKLDRLRYEVERGAAAVAEGRYADYAPSDMDKLGDEIKANARQDRTK